MTTFQITDAEGRPLDDRVFESREIALAERNVSRGEYVAERAIVCVVKLPPVFYFDHVSRELPAGRVLRETKRDVLVELTLREYDELLSDAQHYAQGWQFGPELFGLSRSAAATVKRLMSERVYEQREKTSVHPAKRHGATRPCGCDKCRARRIARNVS